MEDLPQKAVNLLKNHGLSGVFGVYLLKKVFKPLLKWIVFK
jgi:hypothetical protein